MIASFFLPSIVISIGECLPADRTTFVVSTIGDWVEIGSM